MFSHIPELSDLVKCLDPLPPWWGGQQDLFCPFKESHTGKGDGGGVSDLMPQTVSSKVRLFTRHKHGRINLVRKGQRR